MEKQTHILIAIPIEQSYLFENVFENKIQDLQEEIRELEQELAYMKSPLREEVYSQENLIDSMESIEQKKEEIALFEQMLNYSQDTKKKIKITSTEA